MARVLVVEDEVAICNLICAELSAEGHTVYQANDGLQALTLVEQHQPQLIILDWMLPGLDGLSVCRRVRLNYLMPILMLTARNEEIDRILGLEVGADDYISKPFSMRELMARVRAMLRRVDLDQRLAQTLQQARTEPPAAQVSPAITPTPGQPPIIRGPLEIDPNARIAKLHGEGIMLTPKEYELLILLASHPGRAFSREFLLQQLWGYDYDGFDRTVDTHVTRLRKKLGGVGEKIVTVWSVGYRFVE
ncbi:response regulator transcription factor [Ktedonobacter robiniae]|uniref:DNA-binding response regulator n=1 Tax=Ktedonobacter robiniae TaxID=2778365 RepID=A0ABQ3UUQ6_9CHLR|nr:response regulator transcription factor [Ktedonobacter robiniae]GHO56584.1 DNA-binding response regulator [Ktedonobacter robiniae]